MATIDLSQGVDFSPLEKLSIPKEDGMKFLGALAPMIDLEFQTKIKNAFTDEESKAIGAEAESKGIKPEDGMLLLEEKYHAKTGRYFMEEMRLLFNQYILVAANIITQARQDTQAFINSGDENNKHFDMLMKEKKYEEAAKFFDETLNKISPQKENVPFST